MTKQEMFDKSCIGLKSQDFQRCISNNGCVYSDGNGHHCAWGWVDPEGTEGFDGDVQKLQSASLGLAATLSDEDVNRGEPHESGFAVALQQAHDRGCTAHEMVSNLRALAARFELSDTVLENCP